MDQIKLITRNHEFNNRNIPSSLNYASREELVLPKIEKSSLKNLGRNKITLMHLFRNKNNDFEIISKFASNDNIYIDTQRLPPCKSSLSKKIDTSRDNISSQKQIIINNNNSDEQSEYYEIRHIDKQNKNPLLSSRSTKLQRQNSNLTNNTNQKKNLAFTSSSIKKRHTFMNTDKPKMVKSESQKEIKTIEDNKNTLNYLNADNLSFFEKEEETDELFYKRMNKWLNEIEYSDIDYSQVIVNEIDEAFDNISEFNSVDDQIVGYSRVMDKTYCFVHND